MEGWQSKAVFADDTWPEDASICCGFDAQLTVHERPGTCLAGPGAILTQPFSATGAGEASVAAKELRVGSVVDGKYRIDGVLGAGGMGTVYRATHLLLERAVALKGIRRQLVGNPVVVERFRREALAVARLRHSHIVTVHDYGVAPDAGAYLVMELLEGHTLREELAQRTRLDVPTALALITQVCAAVGAAHQAGVIHRDLKPENIFLDDCNRAVAVKLVDFGLAKLEAVSESMDWGLMHGGELVGTPGYMSPEQCRLEEADARSDVYALGCVLYEMVTGMRPFGAKTAVALAYQHVYDAPRRPSELVPGIAPSVEAALMRALAKAPADRHQTAEAFADALVVPGGVASTTEPFEALGVREQHTRSGIESVEAWFRDKSVLRLFDECEHENALTA
jgi:serine/threonine-protein kinase